MTKTRSTLHSFLLSLLCGCSLSNIINADKVRLALDTDLGPDCDDVGVIAVMYALADSGYVDILATILFNKSELTIPYIETISTYFKRPDIPLGAAKGESAVTLECPHNRKWVEVLPRKYTHRIAKSSGAFGAVKIYRSILCTQSDSSVTVCTIGAFSDLKELLQLKGDKFSPETGVELVCRKVKQSVSMAGVFPEEREYNIYCDVSSSFFVVNHWPTGIIFCGFETGCNITIDCRVSRVPVENHPIKDAFLLYVPQGRPQGRWSWDQVIVQVAIRGHTPHYINERGVISVDSKGNNMWGTIRTGKHIRLVESLPVKEMKDLLKQYTIYYPKH